MLDMTQLQTILLYPFRDAAARKNFLIAAALMFGNFIIPILPMIFLMGYIARIMRQIIDEKQEASMPEWDDWNAYLTDGLRIWGFRMVFFLPLLLILFGGMGLFFVFFFIGTAQSDSHTTSPFLLGGMLVFFIVMAIFMVLAIPLGIASMAGSAHVVAKKSFSAGFAFKEWWQIFYKNLGAFLLYYIVAMAVSFVLTFALQILYLTIILICLLPIVFPVIMAYLLLIQDVLFAHAYAQGRDMLTVTDKPSAILSSAEGDQESLPSA
jgi:hypothetical protein